MEQASDSRIAREVVMYISPEWIPPEHREIDEFLTSWGRWLKSAIPQGHCRSIEHRYTLRRLDDTPEGWDKWATTPPIPPRTPLNERHAIIVESVMRVVLHEPRRLLVLKYYKRATPQVSARKLHFAYHLYGDKLYAARQITLNLVRHVLFPTTHGRFGLDSGLKSAQSAENSGKPANAEIAA